MAYVPFVSTEPASSQTGTAFATSANANDVSLRDAVVSGSTGSWTASVVNGSGTAEEPQYRVWSNGALRIRATFTYSTGYATSILWEYSSDSGTTPNATGTWSTMWTETVTYDGSKNITGGNNSSRHAWMYEWIGKFKALRTTVATLGTALYDATAVAITGGTIGGVAITTGTIDGTTIGATTRALGTFKQAREVHSSVAFVSGTNTLDWSTAGSFSFTATGTGAATLTGSNFPPSGIAGSIVVDITNGGLRTWTWTNVKWAAGTAPTLSTSGRDKITFFTRDGGTTIDGGLWAKGLA